MGYAEDAALLSAIENGDNLAVETMLAKKEADVNADIGMATPLEAAIMGRNHYIMDLLVKTGACINKRNNNNGRTALHAAAKQIEESWATYLLARGAEINAADNEGLTPLHIAVRGGRFYPNCKVVQLLINKGADLTAKDNQGRTPYMATPEEFVDIRECLLQNMEKQKRLSDKEALRNSFFNLSSEEICVRLMTSKGLKEAKSAFPNDLDTLVQCMVHRDAMRAYVHIYKNLTAKEKETYSKAIDSLNKRVSTQQVIPQPQRNGRER